MVRWCSGETISVRKVEATLVVVVSSADSEPELRSAAADSVFEVPSSRV